MFNATHLQKKARMGIKHGDILPQHTVRLMQHLLDMYNQEQMVLSLSPAQQVQLIQQMKNNQQPATAVNRPLDGAVCAQRLMQFLYHQRHEPTDVSYWRGFVCEYYSPHAKHRCCVSNVGNHPSVVFPPANTDIWECGICGSKSGRGFEAAFEVLPRLNEIKFANGVINEMWCLDLPQECRLPSGYMMLNYEKAVQETVYEQLHVIHEGRLKVIFSPDLKIVCWEFCSRRHEELLPHCSLTTQVNQMLEVAQKLQSSIAKSGSGGGSQQDLQTSSSMLVTAGRQLANALSGDQVALHPGSMNNNILTGGRGPVLANYQNTPMRQNPVNSDSRQDASSSFSKRSPFHAQVLQNNNSNINIPVGYQRSLGGIFQVQQNQNQNQQAVQIQMIQQVLKGMNDNNDGGEAKPFSSGQSGGGPT